MFSVKDKIYKDLKQQALFTNILHILQQMKQRELVRKEKIVNMLNDSGIHSANTHWLVNQESSF